MCHPSHLPRPLPNPTELDQSEPWDPQHVYAGGREALEWPYTIGGGGVSTNRSSMPQHAAAPDSGSVGGGFEACRSMPQRPEYFTWRTFKPVVKPVHMVSPSWLVCSTIISTEMGLVGMYSGILLRVPGNRW